MKKKKTTNRNKPSRNPLCGSTSDLLRNTTVLHRVPSSESQPRPARRKAAQPAARRLPVRPSSGRWSGLAAGADTRSGSHHGRHRTKGLREPEGRPPQEAGATLPHGAGDSRRTEPPPLPPPGAARFQAQAPPGARPALCSLRGR